MLINDFHSAKDRLRDSSSHILVDILRYRYCSHVHTPSPQLSREMGRVPDARRSWIWGWTTASGFFLYLHPDGELLLTSIKQGIISIQGVTTGEELSSGMAFMVFIQALFPAIALSLCNLVLVSSLKSQLRIHVPNADAAIIIKAGATSFRSVVDSADLEGVITAYANSVGHVFSVTCDILPPENIRP